MKTIGPSYTELGELILPLLKQIDSIIEKGESSSELLELVITAREQIGELKFNIDRLAEYLEEERKKRIQKLIEEDEEE
ncbi:hypothetical protein J5U23_02885 [Saccharolobus shibatae B12]|uniref:Uncharacterized protein n=1 Tax=Saccharolobus shibatae (strain ATCC 51178 / DSM 5389 / JCM 8931 / NBRC 15437 / B12) TaxID=523848 RepID=A0A8F5BRI6_SACSH|nr:hypothetical protein [Saccharolobus shibatae]QXJ27103.1 hypothetical protein J5U23_p2885 [Saccharolobus shibatae B12]QXJ29996.1 hypothetical protein J5U23_02885 [Saccharolobus shibatae B12]